MGYFLLLIAIGLSLFAVVYIVARLRVSRMRFTETLPQSVVQVNLLDNDDAVVVAEGRGRLIFANPKAQTWFGMNGGEPDLELMADAVQPSDTFLELFSKEGQATFRIGNRRVEATSHYVPRQDAPQIVVVMRERASVAYPPDELNPQEALNALSEIGQIISSKPRLDDMLEAVLNVVKKVIEYDVGEVTLWDEDLQVMRSRGRHGEAQYFEQFDSTDGVYHLDDSFSGWIARYRQNLFISDTALRADVHPKLGEYGLKSYVGVPIIVGERFIGALELGSRTRRAFKHEDMEWMHNIAYQIGVAIENARLYENQTERVAELSGLQQVVGAVSAIDDRRQMFSLIVSRIAALLNVEKCGILIYDEVAEELIGQLSFYGVGDAIVSMYRIPVPTGSLARAIFEGQDAWYANDVRTNEAVRATGLSSLAEAVGVRTTALARMTVGYRRLGVVQVANKRDASGFSEDDIRLLSVFASQVAIVVENAHLYDSQQRRHLELGSLQAISRAVGNFSRTEDLYAQINVQVAKLMDVQMAGVLLLDETGSEMIGQSPFFGVEDNLLRHYRLNVQAGSAFHTIFYNQEYWISNELRTDPILHEAGLEKLAMLIGVRQIMMVPLLIGGRRLGALQIANQLHAGEFTDEDARVLQIAAAQVATILESNRLGVEVGRRTDEADSLRRIARVIASETAIDRLIHSVIREIVRSLNCDVGAVGLLDESSGTLVMKPEWSAGMDEMQVPYQIDTYAPGFQTSVLITGRSFWSNNLRSDTRVLPIYKAFAERYNFNAAMQVPLRTQDRRIGEMTVGSRRENAFNGEDLHLLEAIAIQVSAVLGRGQLTRMSDEDAHARARELDAVMRVSNELIRTTELDRVVEVIRTEAQRTLYAEMATVTFYAPYGTWPTPDQPVIEKRWGGGTIREIAPVEWRAAMMQTIMTINDYANSDLIAEPAGTKNAIAAPILFGDHVAGMLHIYNTEMAAFSTATQDFVRALANQLALVYANEQRFRDQTERAEALRQRTDQLNQIYEIGRLLRSGEALEDVLEAVAYGVRETVGFNVVVISAVDQEKGVSRRLAQAGLPIATWEQARQVTPALSNLDRIFQPRFLLSSSYFVPEESADVLAGMPTIANPNLPLTAPRGKDQWLDGDLLIVPLRGSNGELIGLMSVDDPRDLKRPTVRSMQALETLGNQAAFAIENFRLVQAFQREAEAARRERDRLEQLYLVASESQRALDIPARLQVVAEGIRAAGWDHVAITLRDSAMEAQETITAGHSREEAAQFVANLLPGAVWQERLTDPELRRYRVGQAYYLRHSDPWMTEAKLMAGYLEPMGRTHETNVPASDEWHPLDTVYLPLYGVDRSRAIGIITLDKPANGKAPTEASLRPIELLAAQASAMVENTRLYEAMTIAALQEQRISELTEVISATLELDEIIQGVARGMQLMIPFDRMTVALFREDREELATRRVTVDDLGDLTVTEGLPVPIEGTALGYTVRNSLAHVYVADDSDATRLSPDAAFEAEAGVLGEADAINLDTLSTPQSDLRSWRAEGEHTTLIVPMVAGGRVVGALHMGTRSAEVARFEDQLPLAARVANMTAVAIENAQLFQETIERERFSTALSRSAQSVTALAGLERILGTICEEVLQVLDAWGVYVWQRDSDILTGIAARGLNADRFPGLRGRITAEDVLANTVLEKRHPTIASSSTEVRRAMRSALVSKMVLEQPAGSVLAVPLLREEKAIGAIVLLRTSKQPRFNDSDLEKASAFALQGAIAIENARLNQETRELQSFNEAVIQSIQQGIVVLDRQMQIRTVNAFMQRVYGWDDGAVDVHLFEYRPSYARFLTEPIENVLVTGNPETRYSVHELDEAGRDVVRNFYVYPLLQLGAVNGIVILVEDVTTRTALEADVASRAQQLTVLTEVSSQLTSLLETEAVVRLMFDELNRFLEYDSATLWLRRDDKLVIRSARGYVNAESLIGIEAEIADSELFRELATRGQVLNIPDVTQDRRFPAFTADQPMRSWLGVSLVSRGNLAGLLVLEKTQVAYYSETMEQLALTFANQCAVALENAQLFQATTNAAEENTRLYREATNRARELDSQTKRLSLLYRVSNALTQSVDLEDVFEVTLRETIQMLGVERGRAYLLDTNDARPVIEHPRGNTPPTEGDTLHLRDSILMEEMRRTLQPVVVRDVLNNPRASSDPILAAQRVLSTMLVPLSVSGQLIGFLEFDATNEYREFTGEQIETAQTIASQAAIAVQNASLLEQSLARARELEMLFEATQSISATLDLNTVIRNIAMQMNFALQADACEILNWNSFENTLVVAIDIPAGESSAVRIDKPGTKFTASDYPVRRRALESRQSILLRGADPHLSPRERALLEERGTTSRILLPMVVREQPLGLIEISIHDPARQITSAELRLARTLAAQAAVAIENAGLQTETASKLAELFVINELSTALTANIDQQRVYQLVRTQLPAMVKAQVLIMGIVEDDVVSYPIALRDGKPFVLESHPLGKDEIGFVYAQSTPQRLVGEEITGVLRNQGYTLRHINPASLVGVPLIAGGKSIGALIVADEQNRYAFNLNDQRILSTVGGQAAVAVQNARLLEQTRQFAAELEDAVRQRTLELQRERDSIDFLYRITSSLTTSLDIDLTLNSALAMMVEAFDADMGVILGIDSISDNLTFRAIYNLTEEVGERSGISTREGLAGWVIQAHQSVVVEDVQNDFRWLQLGVWETQPRGAIATLLEANEDTLGVAILFSTTPGKFTEAQLRVLEAVASQVASAMNNADLYALIREQAERLAAMVRREQVDSTKNLAIVESIADGIMVANREGEVTQFNSAAERILGLARRQIIGRDISALSGVYQSTGGQNWVDAIQRWTHNPTDLHSGEEVRTQLSLDNGKYVGVSLAPVVMGDQFLGTVTVFRDITREIEVDRMKSEFVATVSHELRTPMTSIKGYADLLLLGAAGKITEQQQRFLTTIKTNADRLSILVNELLDISRIDRGVVKLNLQPTDLLDVVDISLQQVLERMRTEKKTVDIQSEIPDDLPLLRADPDKLTQVLNHLVNNAYNYTNAGGQVRIRAQAEENAVVVAVSDSGIGISKEKQDRIWERFFRDEEQSLVMETSGAGLGLSIVKEYVDMHNGQVWLESEVGKGSTFYFRIPAFTSEN